MTTPYPDNHPEVREHVITITTPEGSRQYMPRERWEQAVADRDAYRKALALISAWRVTSGTRDPHLDALLERAGETYDSARAMHGLIQEVRR